MFFKRVIFLAIAFLFIGSIASNSQYIFTWGHNVVGQLGLGDTINRNVPNQAGTGNNWISIDAGSFFNIGLKSDGTLWSWGHNDYGQLGLGDQTKRNTPTQLGTETNWSKAKGGGYHSIAIKSNGTLWTWGRNAEGQLGLGYTNPTRMLTPSQVGSDNSWSEITAGDYFTLAIKSNGTLWAWGSNEHGQLGLGYYVPNYRSSPEQVGSGTNWSKVSAGAYHTIAIKTDGTLWAWGYNNYGQLGIGSSPSSTHTPIQVGTDNNWAKIYASDYHSFAIKTNGTLWAWGLNENAQLGIGNTSTTHTPVQVGTDTDWESVAGGYIHSIARKTDGTIWSWGYNNYGQLGIGSSPFQATTPQQIGTRTEWLLVSGGYYHSIAISTVGLATVTTAGIHSITVNSAMGGGEVTDNGGLTVTARGIVWGINQNPTLDSHENGSYTSNGSGNGTFASSMTGLTQGLTYSVRAYATNAVGTSYGPTVTFTTIPTLPEWGLIILGILTALFTGYWVFKNYV